MPEHGVQENCCLIAAAVKHLLKAFVCADESVIIAHLQIGVMYGNPEVTSGGNALKFYASVRLEVRRKATQESSKGDSIGIRVKAKVNRFCVLCQYRCEHDKKKRRLNAVVSSKYRLHSQLSLHS